MKPRILTGDRPTGKLHLGHYVGSLANRNELQDKYDCYFIIADYQVLTDRLENTASISKSIYNIVLDYLSVGIDPKKSIIFIQSKIPQIAELTILFSFIVSMARVQRNPTVKEEFSNTDTGNISLGFVSYPVSQAADILCVRSNLIPVGGDQLPHVEQTREIAKRFNQLFAKVFPIPKALVGTVSRLVGLDGRKMSKSLGNAIYLSDSQEIIKTKIRKAITDPARVRVNDKGHPDICNIFQYHMAFADKKITQDIKLECEKGKIGCVECKKRLVKILKEFLEPIRKKRAYYIKNTKLISEILEHGNKVVCNEAQKTLDLVKEAMKMNY